MDKTFHKTINPMTFELLQDSVRRRISSFCATSPAPPEPRLGQAAKSTWSRSGESSGRSCDVQSRDKVQSQPDPASQHTTC